MFICRFRFQGPLKVGSEWAWPPHTHLYGITDQTMGTLGGTMSPTVIPLK